MRINDVGEAISKNKRSHARKAGRRSASSSSTSGRNPIDRMGTEKLFSPNENIFRKGQSARHIYKVKFGCIRTYANLSDGRRVVSAFYFPRNYFGLEVRDKHIISAEAITPSMVLVIRRQALTLRATTDIVVAKHLLAITNVELQRAQNHSLLLRNKSAHERVANFLFELKKRNRRKEVDLLMSRQDIADHLNLKIETVSRALTRLEKKSAISFLTHRRIAVHIRQLWAT